MKHAEFKIDFHSIDLSINHPQDFDLGREYLESLQQNGSSWSCSESGTLSMKLSSGHEEEEVAVEIEEYDDKVALAFSGSGISRFVNDILPEFAAITSWEVSIDFWFYKINPKNFPKFPKNTSKRH